MDYTYRKDQELPSIPVHWEANDGAPRDFSSGWTLTAKVCLASAPLTIVLTKTSGVTGAASFPNVTINWAAADFSGLTASTDGTQYVVYLYATRASDSKDDVFPGTITFTLKTAPS